VVLAMIVVSSCGKGNAQLTDQTAIHLSSDVDLFYCDFMHNAPLWETSWSFVIQRVDNFVEYSKMFIHFVICVILCSMA
jgi:hypothetical protein